MSSYLHSGRPPVYCPGCTHERVVGALDRALDSLGLAPDKVVIVSDIGCSGLFDTFFDVHALHGLHGRALTYAAGLKLANPELWVIVTMGDGGLGIGGAHLLAACRRNLDLTLVVMNNFNFGMTGGQCSVTTPSGAKTGSAFLNQAEMPVDVCAIAESAGATFVGRCSGLADTLPDLLAAGIAHRGFALVETLGLCTGRYTKSNALNPSALARMVAELPAREGVVAGNMRQEYGERYRQLASECGVSPQPVRVEQTLSLKSYGRQEVSILGSAGMRIVTAGELLCHGGLAAGFNVSLKNDYNITVLRGQSVSEVIISPEPIGYTGSSAPSVVLALSEEGVQQRRKMFSSLTPGSLVVRECSVAIPDCDAELLEMDCTSHKIVRQDWALAALSILAARQRTITWEMLDIALRARFHGRALAGAQAVVDTMRAAVG